MYDQALTSDKPGKASRGPVKRLICSGDVSDVLWIVVLVTGAEYRPR